jgi:hypothetical protein
MQTKSYYRLLNWTLMACVAASLATACVVTTGDGDDDDDFSFAGDNDSGTSGKTSTTGGAGSSGTAGTAGTTSGNGGSAGTSTTAGTGGTGGTGVDENVGICMGNDDPEPTELPNCDPDDKDDDDACRKCMRATCCTEWKTCYGDSPHIACGWGADPADDYEGQFDCIRNCYAEKIETAPDDESKIKEDCSFECLKQCDSDGVIMDATNDLLSCVGEDFDCNATCFPPPM